MSAEDLIVAGRARLALTLALAKSVRMRDAYEQAVTELVELAEACARGLDATAPATKKP